MSLDGSIAGPNETDENGLGDGGERLHDWVFPPEGGVNVQIHDEFMSTGAVVAGQRHLRTRRRAGAATTTTAFRSGSSAARPARMGRRLAERAYTTTSARVPRGEAGRRRQARARARRKHRTACHCSRHPGRNGDPPDPRAPRGWSASVRPSRSRPTRARADTGAWGRGRSHLRYRIRY